MCLPVKGLVRPSWTIASSAFASPMRKPKRACLSMYGAFDIDSMPPATATCRSPARTAWSTIPAERSPEAHTLLTVSEGTSLGMPALICAWRLGICPWPAWSTCPNTTFSTCSGPTSARSSAAAMAVPPRSVASSGARPPPILPNGVRAAPRITVLGMWSGLLCGDRKPYPPGMASRTMRRAVLIAMVALGLLPGTASAQGVDLTCQFALTRLDHTTTNVLALDTNAVYWATHYAAAPGSRIRIEGHYPFARYFSWNAYDPAGRPIDALSDLQIPPDPPGAYTAFVAFGPRPADPAPNTMYTGESPTGQLWYRVYVPEEGRDAKGGVPLPRVTLEGPAGAGPGAGVEACRETQAPYLPTPSAPALPDPTPDGDGYPGRNPPEWRLFENLCGSAGAIPLGNQNGEGPGPPGR